MPDTIQKLVASNRGLIDRRIFTDRDIYEQELEQIFGRCWLLVGHETQIRNTNDFVAAYMGEDPVLVTKDAKGKVHTFLNMCRHRGNRICRADYGNAQSFMCTYHGWTFATDGKLVGVPGFKEAYFEELDRSQWGLVEARVETYKGLVFATWDTSAPSLRDYLGDMAWYLDIHLDATKGGTEVIAGVQRWVMNTNWKMPADNVGGDSYHGQTTHGSTRMLRSDPNWMDFSRTPFQKVSAAFAKVPSTASPTSSSWQVSPGNGHGIVGFGGGEYAIDSSLPALKDPAAKHIVSNLPEIKNRLGEFRAKNAGSAQFLTVFPNFSLHPIRIWHPRGPTKTEVWLYLMVEKDAPQEVKDAFRFYETHSHGPNGFMELDDIVNYANCTESGKYSVGRRYPMNLQLKLGQQHTQEDIPGMTVASPGELNQRDFYSWWAQLMDASSWSQIKLNQYKKR